MNIHKIKKNAVPFLKKRFYPLVNLYNRLGKNSERLISRNEIFLFDKKNEKITSTNSKFVINLNNFEEELNSNIDRKIPSIFGWVPYIKNKSKILIYHFFSINYSLRKNFLIRITLIDKLKVIKQNCFWMPPMDISEIDLTKIWNNLEGQSIFVESFHPRLPPNHGNQDGHMRFWGNYYDKENNLKSTVHSLPQEKKSKYQIKDLFSRSLVSNFKDENTLHFSAGRMIKKHKDLILTPMGFNMILDKKNNPVSTWHDGPAHAKTLLPSNDKFYNNSEKPKIKESTQGFWCPPIKNLDPLIFIDERETKLKENKLTFTIVKENEITEQKTINVNGSVRIKVSEIFKKRINGPYSILCKFRYKSYTKLVIRYDSIDSSGDCVHAWDCNWKIENNKLEPEIISNNSTARKFFYFKNNLQEEKIKYFLLLYINKKKTILPNDLKIRFLLDNKKEILKTIRINFDQPMQILDLNELFEFKDAGNFNNGIVQIESIYDNILSTFFICNTKENTVVTDHLTGG